ncbi:slipin family protein [Candidatus Acetothermia bacterium]|nr:slipin family protein [Candidatus Acetothermia bacterium]MCI2427227.1 slipin family protein [Candidatus Acetothermia bacterium]MCI2428653.1 slipin family protein [Candidatus Acetothermia bacterium]
MLPIIAVIAIVVIILISAIRIVQEYERGVIFRLGRLVGAKGPGIFFIIPIVDRMVRVSLRTIVFDVPPQDIITKDNVTVSVNAVLYFRVMNPAMAVVAVEHYIEATRQISMTTLRGVLGAVDLDELISERDRINEQLQKIIDEQTDPWGIKVSTVEIKEVNLPAEMQRTIAQQAEAERERRAKIINADGELQAATKLSEAADMLQQHPIAVQLRYLQTLRDISAETTNTIIFPLPIELLALFKQNRSE